VSITQRLKRIHFAQSREPALRLASLAQGEFSWGKFSGDSRSRYPGCQSLPGDAKDSPRPVEGNQPFDSLALAYSLSVALACSGSFSLRENERTHCQLALLFAAPAFELSLQGAGLAIASATLGPEQTNRAAASRVLGAAAGVVLPEPFF